MAGRGDNGLNVDHGSLILTKRKLYILQRCHRENLIIMLGYGSSLMQQGSGGKNKHNT